MKFEFEPKLSMLNSYKVSMSDIKTFCANNLSKQLKRKNRRSSMMLAISDC
ncbi:hypothetical protein PS834_02965 [Pseudomonas fluorescens]|nr:hypothetical protein PS834_02965 [Pseudomonas fluorescens]